MHLTKVGSNATAPQKAMRAMFEARKRVFIDLLGWNLPTLADTYEIDQFDDIFADYLILTDRKSAHLASARLLRTDRPHILGDLFAHLCDGGVPTGPDIREITRFCLDPSQRAAQRRETRNRLVTALVAHALANGVSAYTGVASQSWYEQIARFGWDCRPLGEPVVMDGQALVALHIRIDAQTPARLKQAGIYRRLDPQAAGMLEHAA